MDDTTAQLEPLSEAADAAGELADIIEGRAPLSQRLSGDDPVISQINRMTAMFRKILIRTRGLSAQTAIGAAQMSVLVKSALEGSKNQGALSSQIFSRSQEASVSAGTVHVNSASISEIASSKFRPPAPVS